MANGGIIGPVNTSTSAVASGVWRLDEAKEKVLDGKWPTIVTGNLTTTNLIVHLDFNNSSCYPGSGTTVNNLISGQPSPTLTNGPTYSTDSSGGYIQLDGVNDSIAFSTTTPFQASSGQSFTRNFWVYVSNGIPTGFTALDGWSAGAGKYTLYIYNAQLFYAKAGIANDGGGPTISGNTWVNVCHVNNVGTNSIYYVNGQLLSTKTFTTTFSSYAAPYYVGANAHDGFYLNGRVAVFHYYNRALTNAEVLENFNAYKIRFGV